ncbi:MAG: hypothetical protein H6818_08120 [Phycisphaerales bacterium]|nr:hypothetical protein [Phycisphaerales bacterium]MCB9862539.1 hypothetical protein [Phycisphaerales bacterium]
MKPTTVDDSSDRAASTRSRQSLPDALAIGQRVRRATLAATALHLIEVRRGAVRGGEDANDVRNSSDNCSAA